MWFCSMHDLNLNSIYYSKMLCHALGEALVPIFMVEVRGVEPLSEMALTKLLRT